MLSALTLPVSFENRPVLKLSHNNKIHGFKGNFICPNHVQVSYLKIHQFMLVWRGLPSAFCLCFQTVDLVSQAWSFLFCCAQYSPVGTGGPVGTVELGVPVSVGGIDVIILHSTCEGSGLHVPSLPHVARGYDGTSPGCWHWKNMSEFTTVVVYASTVTSLARVGGAPQSTMLTGQQKEELGYIMNHSYGPTNEMTHTETENTSYMHEL